MFFLLPFIEPGTSGDRISCSTMWAATTWTQKFQLPLIFLLIILLYDVALSHFCDFLILFFGFWAMTSRVMKFVFDLENSFHPDDYSYLEPYCPDSTLNSLPISPLLPCPFFTTITICIISVPHLSLLMVLIRSSSCSTSDPFLCSRVNLSLSLMRFASSLH